MIKIGIICLMLLQIDAVLSALLMVFMVHISKKIQRKKTLQDWIKNIKKKRFLFYLTFFELLRLFLFYVCIRYIFCFFHIDNFLLEIGLLAVSFFTTAFRWGSFYRYRTQILKVSGL